MYTDGRWLRIPNTLTYPAMALGVAFGAIEGLPGALFVSGFVDHVAAVFLAFAFSYPFYAAGGLKAGDAKLLMAIGALRGTSFLLVATVYGAVIGGILAIGFITVRRVRAAGAAEANSMAKVMKSSMPYGIALALGGLLAWGLETAKLINVGGPV
jgi:prepilin peptidase CpaA